MRSVFERIALVAVLGGVLGMLPLLPAGAETLGTVVSTAGDAFVESADGRRPLDCGASVGAGERIVTQAGARLSLVAGDVYLQLDPGASVAIAWLYMCRVSRWTKQPSSFWIVSK